VTIREDVRSPLTGHRYSNFYTINDQGHVIASNQRLGPLLPVWQTSSVKQAPRLPAARRELLANAWSAGPVKLTVKGLQTIETRTQATLNAILQPLLVDTRIDWANSALYCSEDNPEQVVHTVTAAQLRNQQAGWVADVRRLAALWQKDGAAGPAQAAIDLADQVALWPVARRVVITAHPARLLFAPKYNLVLRCNAYTLVLSGNTSALPVMGLSHTEFFNAAAASPLQRFDAAALRRPGASPDELLSIDAAGHTKVFSLNPYSRKPTTPLLDVLLQAGDRLLVPWQQSALPPGFEDLNQRLAALVPHRVLEASHAR
jgi:hypothetical protein